MLTEIDNETVADFAAGVSSLAYGWGHGECLLPNNVPKCDVRGPMQRNHRERWRVVIALTWALLSALAVMFVLIFVVNAPYADEWEFVPVLVGAEPLGPALWSQHNEHRMPLSRAIYFTAFRWTRDFRTGSMLQVALLATLCLGLIRLVGHWRGRNDWTDLFFPLTLLHAGHWENWVMGYQICFALYTVGVTLFALLVITAQRHRAVTAAWLGGFLTLVIATTGGFGLPMAWATSLWLLYMATFLWREKRHVGAVVTLGMVLGFVAYLTAYFWDYQRPEHHPPLCFDLTKMLPVAGEVIAMGWGIAAGMVWPLAAFGVLIATCYVLRCIPPDRHVAPVRWGVTAMIAGQIGLALSIGIARGGFGADMGLWSRYSLLAWPLVGLCYLLAVRFGQRHVTVALCLIAALFFPGNMIQGLYYGGNVLMRQQALAEDAAAGWPPDQLVERHFPASFNAGQEERGRVAIPLLRQAGIGIFRLPPP
jgi:hypothetical protein